MIWVGSAATDGTVSSASFVVDLGNWETKTGGVILVVPVAVNVRVVGNAINLVGDFHLNGMQAGVVLDLHDDIEVENLDDTAKSNIALAYYTQQRNTGSVQLLKTLNSKYGPMVDLVPAWTAFTKLLLLP